MRDREAADAKRGARKPGCSPALLTILVLLIIAASVLGFAAVGDPKDIEATLVAAHAGEMISELTLAVTSKLPMEALAETVHCYPTQAEVFQRIALEYVKSAKQESMQMRGI